MDIWMQLGRYSVLCTNRLILRPFSYSDTDDFYKISSQEENVTFIFPVQTRVTSDYLAVHAFMKNPLGIWAIEDKESQQMIGVIRLEHLMPKQKSAEIGYFLHRDFWNRGLMTEALKMIASTSLNNCGLDCLKIITHLENKASQKVALKSGFSIIKQFRGSDRYTHQMRRYVMYELRKGVTGYE